MNLLEPASKAEAKCMSVSEAYVRGALPGATIHKYEYVEGRTTSYTTLLTHCAVCYGARASRAVGTLVARTSLALRWAARVFLCMLYLLLLR